MEPLSERRPRLDWDPQKHPTMGPSTHGFFCSFLTSQSPALAMVPSPTLRIGMFSMVTGPFPEYTDLYPVQLLKQSIGYFNQITKTQRQNT